MKNMVEFLMFVCPLLPNIESNLQVPLDRWTRIGVERPTRSFDKSYGRKRYRAKSSVDLVCHGFSPKVNKRSKQKRLPSLNPIVCRKNFQSLTLFVRVTCNTMHLSGTIETNESVESNGCSEGADNDNGSLIWCVLKTKKIV